MPFVLDASVTVCWAFADEDHPLAAMTLERMRIDTAIVPSLWWFEVRNTLIMSERRGRLTEADTASFLHDLSRLTIMIDRTPNESAILTIARAHRLSIYDASYLELAQRERIQLATLDKELIKAATALGSFISGMLSFPTP